MSEIGSQKSSSSTSKRRGKLKQIIQTQAVLIMGTIGAIVTCFLVPPDREYLGYIDFHTIGLLFSLLLISEAGKDIGVFRRVGNFLLNIADTRMKLAFALVFLPFFTSMIVTNDVALITFVPLAIGVLKRVDAEEAILNTVALQTIAANLGAIFTPLGSPQNLYLSHKASLSFVDVAVLTAPYVGLSAVGLAVAIMVMAPWKTPIDKDTKKAPSIMSWQLVVYTLLFCAAVACVAKLLPLPILVVAVVIMALIDRPSLFAKLDYSLLATFVVFFIFVGNLGRLDVVNQGLSSLVSSSLRLSAVLSSQVLSNVPATLLLTGFTDRYGELLIAVNIGGLGTVIASMASLISYRHFVAQYPDKGGTYLLRFTILNLIFLAALLGLGLVI